MKYKKRTNDKRPEMGYSPHMPDQNDDLLTIDSIVAGGDGLARRADGCVVFVPRTAPGELVRVEYTETHRQWRRARVLRIEKPSPDRRDPPCPYYGACGGCQLQHLRYEAQLRAKASIVTDALRRIGGFEAPAIDVVPSPGEFGYRNRISFVLRRGGTGVAAGFHGVDDPDAVVDIAACPLAEEPINEVWSALRSSWGPAAEKLPGGELRLTLRVNHAGRVGLAIETVGNRPAPGRYTLDRSLVETIEPLESVWVMGRRGEISAAAGAPALSERIGPYEFALAGTAFVQVNRDVAASMDAYVREQCGDVAGRRVIDAYSGFGTRALDLADGGAIALGIDTDGPAVAAAARLAHHHGLAAAFVAARVERRIARDLPADVVILNPPRSGVAAAVTDALVKTPAGRVVYVSCDPATLARDLKRLATRYRPAAWRAFDLFPQTAHVETVVTLDFTS